MIWLSYKVKDRVYTDNPLLDGIVYNVQLMVDGIVLKDQQEADKYETKESLELSETYCIIKAGNQSFITFDYDDQILTELGKFSSDEVLKYSNDNSLIPMEYRDELVTLASEKFLENYVEQNNYYRRLGGLPDYGTPDFYLDESLVPDKYKKFFDFTIPITEYSSHKIGMLERYGVLEVLQNMYPDLEFLHHLGEKQVNIFDARIASNFELLYLPSAEPMVENRFKEILEKNRLIFLKRYYSLAYKFNSDYYDKFIIIMIICQSMIDIITETPEWYIRRDVFDLRTVEYVLTANGVKFFSKIPLKYQVSLVHILNRVVKYKSCNQNIFDLAGIFDFDDFTIYKHYLLKRRKVNAKEEYVTVMKEEHTDSDDPLKTELVEDLERMYELLFIRCPVDESYDNYINDNINLTDYETVTTNDPYWDGTDPHELVKSNILKKDFTTQATKYLSFEAIFDISNYQFQIVYFLNLIMNVDMDVSKLLLKVPVISDTGLFELRDLIILLYLISFNYYEVSTPDLIENTNRYNLSDHIKYTGIDYDPEALKDYNCDDTPVQLYECDGGSFRRNHTINCNGGYAWSDKEEYDPAKFKDSDGRYSFDLGSYVDCDGGKAYHQYPLFKNMNGSDSTFSENHDTSEDVVKEDDILDYDGSVSYGYEYYLELDGSNWRNIDRDEVADGGKSHHGYFNYKTGTDYYDDISVYFKEEFEQRDAIPVIDMTNRIYGFNLKVDLDYISEVISKRHIHFGWTRGYTLEDLGVDKFVTVEDGKYISPEQLVNIYNENKKAYDNLVNIMSNASNQSEYEVYDFVFKSLFTVDMNQDYFKKSDDTMYLTYTEYLENTDPLLIQFFDTLMMEEELEVRQSMIADYVDSIIECINKYLGDPAGLSNIFYFMPTVSWNVRLQYLYLLIDFFKSYKTQFLEIGASLYFNHALDCRVNMYDKIAYLDAQLDKIESINTLDTFASFDVEMDKKDDGIIPYDKIFIFPEYEKKCYMYNGGPARTQLVYVNGEGNKFYGRNGYKSKHDNGYDDFDGGSFRNWHNVKQTIDAQDADNGNSAYCQNESFYDMFGGVSKDIFEEDRSYKIILDWNGATAFFVVYEYDIDGGPGKEQVFYADYCNPLEWKLLDPKDIPVTTYSPTYDGLNCNGGISLLSDESYNYEADGGDYRTVAELDIAGDKSFNRWYYQNSTNSVTIDKDLYDISGKIKISNIISNGVKGYLDGLLLDVSDYATYEDFSNQIDQSELVINLRNQLNEVESDIVDIDNCDIESEIKSYINQYIQEKLDSMELQISNFEESDVVKQSNTYTDDSIKFYSFEEV